MGLHETLQPLAREVAADLREGVPGQRGGLSLRQPAGQLQVVRRGVVVHEARTHGRTHEAVRLTPQPQPHATLARRLPALECGMQLRHEAAHLVLAALPHAYLDAAVPILAHQQ